jgi:hypothetical protein
VRRYASKIHLRHDRENWRPSLKNIFLYAADNQAQSWCCSVSDQIRPERLSRCSCWSSRRSCSASWWLSA